MKTALVIGATGLVGSQLVQLLLADNRFDSVVVFARRSTGLSHPKLTVHLINFDGPAEWQHLVTGDVLFSTLGTTLKQAGGKKGQYKVDYTYQHAFAAVAAQNSVPVYVLVSASGANPKSLIFYSRIKGELEREVSKLPFVSITILQPGLLTGSREQQRPGENLAFRILTALNTIGILKAYRPIHASVVAKAMINAAITARPDTTVFTLNKLFILAETQ